MSSRISGRPLRTRIYGANYDIGESYYKSALDNLDRKQYGARPSVAPELPIPRPARKTRFALDEDSEFDDALQSARARAHRAITEEPAFFDSRGSRIRGASSLLNGDDSIDVDVQDSLTRIRAARQQKIAALSDELDLDDAVSTFRKKAVSDLKSFADDADDFASTKLRGRKILWKVDSDVEPAMEASKSLVSKFKKTVISDSKEVASDSAAAVRAKASRARIADIESDMFDRSERLLEREKRAANLKKMLADSDFD